VTCKFRGRTLTGSSSWGQTQKNRSKAGPVRLEKQLLPNWVCHQSVVVLKLNLSMRIHILRDGQPFGPFSAGSIREMLKLGVVFESDLARYEGTSEWIPLARLCDCNPPQSSGAMPAEFGDHTKVVSAAPIKPRHPLASSAVGALIVAVVGGWIWAEVAISADREFRIIALVIAFCCASTVVYCSLGGRGPRFQLVACGATLAGILIGKSGVAWHLTRLTREAEGTAPDSASWLNAPGMLAEAFARHFPHVFGVSDFLWILLAMVTAWGIPGMAQKES